MEDATADSCPAPKKHTNRRLSLVGLVESFWKRVDKSGDCWLWTGEVNNRGYGVITIYDRDQQDRIMAHRFSAMLSGMSLPSSKVVVMHACDTPKCVRPDHLSVGTQQDNIQDACDKSRIDLTGLTAPTPHDCRECGAGFMGAPGARFCSRECYLVRRRRTDLQRRRSR